MSIFYEKDVDLFNQLSVVTIVKGKGYRTQRVAKLHVYAKLR